MQTIIAPPSDHQRFDELCERLDTWEPLTSIRATPPEPDVEDEEDRRSGPLNDLILAGLVSPY
jgi:hypothetical protein